MLENNTISTIVKKILLYCYGENAEKLKEILQQKIKKSYNKKEQLNFIMPAFPGKSPNENSCFSYVPDYTENIAIKTINHFINEVNHIYPYGCSFTIIHDGHFFYYLNITRSEQELNKYISDFRKKCNSKIISKTIYDLMGSDNLGDCINMFKKKYLSEETVGGLSSEILFTRKEFSEKIYGIAADSLTNTQKKKIATKIAKESIHIKNGISNMINSIYADSIRLSVHFQKQDSGKMGFKLIPNAINKGTPWFYVAFVSDNNKIILGKRNWNFASKKECISKNGKFFSINKFDIYNFENNLTSKTIEEERWYNR